MRERVISWLADNVPEARLRHILGVEKMSVVLAKHYQIDEMQAAQAGLMHDLAKYFQPQKLLKMAQEHHISIDSVCAANPHLLHADVSAIVAQQEFAVVDEKILGAIRNHTLGCPQMSDLSCVVFVADALEPGRGNKPELEAMRQVSFTNLYKSVWQTCDYSLKYLLDKKRIIHPRAIYTRNWAMQKAKEQGRKILR